MLPELWPKKLPAKQIAGFLNWFKNEWMNLVKVLHGDPVSWRKKASSIVLNTLWSELGIVLANQIIGILKQPYLKNKMMNLAEILLYDLVLWRKKANNIILDMVRSELGVVAWCQPIRLQES